MFACWSLNTFHWAQSLEREVTSFKCFAFRCLWGDFCQMIIIIRNSHFDPTPSPTPPFKKWKLLHSCFHKIFNRSGWNSYAIVNFWSNETHTGFVSQDWYERQICEKCLLCWLVFNILWANFFQTWVYCGRHSVTLTCVHSHIVMRDPELLSRSWSVKYILVSCGDKLVWWGSEFFSILQLIIVQETSLLIGISWNSHMLVKFAFWYFCTSFLLTTHRSFVTCRWPWLSFRVNRDIRKSKLLQNFHLCSRGKSTIALWIWIIWAFALLVLFVFK